MNRVNDIILQSCSVNEIVDVLQRFPSYSDVYRKAHEEYMKRLE